MSVHVGLVSGQTLWSVLSAVPEVQPPAGAPRNEQWGQAQCGEVLRLLLQVAWSCPVELTTSTVLRAAELFYLSTSRMGCPEWLEATVRAALLVAAKVEQGRRMALIDRGGLRHVVGDSAPEVLAKEADLLRVLEFNVAFPTVHQLVLAGLTATKHMHLRPLAEAALLAFAGTDVLSHQDHATRVAELTVLLVDGAAPDLMMQELVLRMWGAIRTAVDGRRLEGRSQVQEALQLLSRNLSKTLGPRVGGGHPERPLLCSNWVSLQGLNQAKRFAAITPLPSVSKFGDLRLARDTKLKCEVLLKRYKNPDKQWGVPYTAIFELSILRLMGSHPHILQLRDTLFEEGLPLAVCESLHTPLTLWLQGPKQPPQVASVLAQLAQALQHIHSYGRVCASLRALNIFTDGAHMPLVKVADFEFSEPQPLDDRQPIVGMANLDFCAPEALCHMPGMRAYAEAWGLEHALPDERVDIWALGLLGVLMVTGANPLQDSTSALRTATLISQLQQQLAEDPLSALPLDGPLADTILSMLRLDPLRRPSAEQLVAELGGDAVDRPPPTQVGALTRHNVHALCQQQGLEGSSP